MSTGSTFGDAGVWSYLLLLALIFISLLLANIIKQKVAPMRRSLIPVSVLGGLLLLTSLLIANRYSRHIFTRSAMKAFREEV